VFTKWFRNAIYGSSIHSVAVAPAATVCEGVMELTEKSSVGVIPVPPRVTICGDPAALSAIESVVVKLVVETGVKVTEMVQLAPAASDSPQLLLSRKLLRLAPVRVIAEILSGPVPELVSVELEPRWSCLRAGC